MLFRRQLVAACFVAMLIAGVESASAGLDLLPPSSHYQGRAYQGVPGDRVRIDFAVYDTRQGNEFAAAGFEAPGDKRYTYVYQIFNEAGSEGFAVEIFRITGIARGAISDAAMIGAVDDQADGVATSVEYFNASFTEGIWEFAEGVLVKEKHSYFLVLSSDYDYAAGGFSLTADPDSEVPVPVPEPATLVMTGIGAVVLVRGRKRPADIRE